MTLKHHHWLVAIGGILSAFMAIIGINATTTATELIYIAVGATADEVSAVTSVYMVAEIITMPLIAILALNFGSQRTALCAVILFALASALCAFSTSLTGLLISRALQGCAAGVLIPIAYTLIKEYLPDHEQGKAMGVFSLFGGLAPVVGPLFGGLLTSDSYHWLFLANIPLCIVCFSLLFIGGKGQSLTSTSTSFLKAAPILFAAIGAGALLFVLEHGVELNWLESKQIVFWLLIGLASIIVFITIQLMSSDPIIHFDVFKNIDFCIASVGGLIVGLAVFGFLFLIPFYLITVQDYSPANVSAVLMYSALPQLIFMPVLIKVSRLIKPLPMIGLASLLAALSGALCTQMTTAFSGDNFALPQVIRAMAIPLMVLPLNLYAMSSISKQRAADGTIIFNLLKNIGGAIGVSGAVALLQYRKSSFYQELLLNHTAPNELTEHVDLINRLDKEALVLSFNFTFSVMAILLTSLGICYLIMHFAQRSFNNRLRELK